MVVDGWARDQTVSTETVDPHRWLQICLTSEAIAPNFLDFALDKIAESREDPAGEVACLHEADGTIGALKKVVLELGDDVLISAFVLLGVFERKLVELPKNAHHEWEVTRSKATDAIRTARDLCYQSS